MVRRYITLLGSALLLTLLFAGSQANADPIRFRYNGGRWSHSRHAGWHRYWGGPATGYYWAEAPVYIVPGYESARYYSGPDYWYSNPSFVYTYGSNGARYHRRWNNRRDHVYSRNRNHHQNRVRDHDRRRR